MQNNKACFIDQVSAIAHDFILINYIVFRSVKKKKSLQYLLIFSFNFSLAPLTFPTDFLQRWLLRLPALYQRLPLPELKQETWPLLRLLDPPNQQQWLLHKESQVLHIESQLISWIFHPSRTLLCHNDQAGSVSLKLVTILNHRRPARSPKRLNPADLVLLLLQRLTRPHQTISPMWG